MNPDVVVRENGALRLLGDLEPPFPSKMNRVWLFLMNL
jgi:hypothetical protein